MTVSGYVAWSVVAGEQPTTAKWNILGTNDAAFNTFLSGPGTASSIMLANPYKFSVYRNAAWTASNGSFGKVAFDTKAVDTGTNFDATTNNRFVAPSAGFYFFDWSINFVVAAAGLGVTALYKNGSLFKQGSASVQGATTAGYTSVGSALVSAAANDYFEIFAQSAASATGGTGQALTFFDGYLVAQA